MLDKLKIRLEELISSTYDDKLLKKYYTIKKILAYDNCFVDMDSTTALNIIKDLNFSNDMSNEIYLELLKEGYGWNIQAS